MSGNSDFRAAMETVFAAAEITGDLLQEMKDHYWKEENKFGSSASIRTQKVRHAAAAVQMKGVPAAAALTRLLEALYVVEGTMRLITHGDRFHAVKDYFSKETD
nr:hypothetical protein [Halomonas sp.]